MKPDHKTVFQISRGGEVLTTCDTRLEAQNWILKRARLDHKTFREALFQREYKIQEVA